LADAIKARFKVQPELIGGSGGVFDVKVDGALLFSKHQAGRFPENDEVLNQLAAQVR
jgi:selT/selW/selH-like putative selenoprotein